MTVAFEKPENRVLGSCFVLLAATLLACGGAEEKVPIGAALPSEPAPANPEDNGITQDPAVIAGNPPATGTSGGPTGIPAVDAACTSYATAYCARTKACAPGLFPALYPNEASCVSSTARRCGIDVGTAGVALGAGGATACATDLGAASCEDFIDGRLPASCRPAGTLTDGAACETALQCASGFCAGATGATCGVCSATVAAGGACVAGTCPAGLTCSKNVCTAKKKIGDACVATRECGTGQVCQAGEACAVAGGLGQLCALDVDCNVLDGFYCSFATNRCAKLAIAAVGQACGVGTGAGTALCGADGDCSNAGVCLARLKEGDACGGGAPRCGIGMACLAGKCGFADASICK